MGPGRLPAARGRAVALRVEPLSKAQHLAPDGLPSLTQFGQAGVAGVNTMEGGGMRRWACRVDPRYHDVLAVKVCAVALGERWRPWAVFEP